MSRHMAILRKAKLDAELFGRGGNGHHGANDRAPSHTLWHGGHGRDAWRQLVHELFVSREEPVDHPAPLAIALASATSGEGTSYVAFHVATELARSTGRPALLLEANVYAPSQAQCCGVEPDPGLGHALADPSFPLESCLRQTAVEQLSLLPAGSVGSGSSGAPDWAHFSRILDCLRERFAGIVADLPALSPSSDTLILAPLFDAVVLVVEADLCSREVIENTVARLRRASASLAGAVLNKRKFFIPEPLYRRL